MVSAGHVTTPAASLVLSRSLRRGGGGDGGSARLLLRPDAAASGRSSNRALPPSPPPPRLSERLKTRLAAGVVTWPAETIGKA